MKTALIYVAMEAEAQPIVHALTLTPFQDPTFEKINSKLFKGEYGDTKIILVTSGKDQKLGVDRIGTDATVYVCTLAIQKYSPDVIFNAGTAGGFRSRGANLFDVYLVEKHAVFHDRRVDVPGLKEYARGTWPTSAHLVSDSLRKQVGIKAGVLSTGNSLDMTDYDAKLIHESQAVVKDMEGAAIAWISHLHQIPFFALKGVTDIVDGEHPTHEEFLRNLSRTATEIAQKTAGLVRTVIDTKLI